MKLKDKLIYIISLICSLYISYLVCRVYVLGPKAVVLVTILISCAFGYLTYLYKKNISYSKLTKKSFIVILVLSIFIATIILKLNYNFFTKQFKETIIEVSSNEQDVEIEGTIKNLVVNNVYYTISGNMLINDGVEADYSRIVIESNLNRIRIYCPKATDIKIIFNSGYKSIHVMDGNSTEIIDTNQEDDDDYVYQFKSNIVDDNFCIIRLIISELLLTYIVFCTIMLIKYTDNKEKRYFVITMLIAVFGMWLYYAKYENIILCPDSLDYIRYNFDEVLHMQLQGRPPIYPLIIAICKRVFCNCYLEAVVAIQYVIWFVSIIFFFKMLKLLTKNIKIVSFFTVIYTLCAAVAGWNNLILTESITLSGTVMVIYFIIKYIKEPKLSSGISAIVISLVLTFCKPTVIIYVMFLEIFWIGRFIFEREHIKVDFKCFIASTISIFIIVIYAIIFHRTFGIYSISDAIPRQDLYVCIHQGYYKSSNNEEFIKKVEESLEKNKDNEWTVMTDVLVQYSLSEVKELTSYCKMQNIPTYIGYISDLAKEHQTVEYYNYALNIERSGIQRIVYATFSFITFSHVYIIMAIEFILIVYKWIKDKKVPWIHCGLLGFPLVIIFSAFIGTCGEFMRTSISVLPFAYVSMAIYADAISKYNEEKDNDRVAKEK